MKFIIITTVPHIPPLVQKNLETGEYSHVLKVSYLQWAKRTDMAAALALLVSGLFTPLGSQHRTIVQYSSVNHG